MKTKFTLLKSIIINLKYQRNKRYYFFEQDWGKVLFDKNFLHCQSATLKIGRLLAGIPILRV